MIHSLDFDQTIAVFLLLLCVHERDCLSSPFTSSAGGALLGFYELFGLSQLINKATHKDAKLDLEISEYPGTVSYHLHLGTSDHIATYLDVL